MVRAIFSFLSFYSFDFCISNIILILVSLCLNPTNTSSHNDSALSVNIKELETSQKHCETFFMKCNQINNIKINAKITYKIRNDKNSISLKDQSIVVSVVEPFTVTSQYLSSCFKEINYCYEESKFIILTCLNVKSPWPIEIENTFVEPVSYVLLLLRKKFLQVYFTLIRIFLTYIKFNENCCF